MANVKRLIGLLAVLLVGLMLSGCAPALTGEFRAAIEEGDLDKVKSILAEKPELVNARGKTHWSDEATPLHVAIHHGKMEIAKLLLAKGADINAKDWTQGHIFGKCSPLHSAVFGGSKVMVEFLIENGANVNARCTTGSTPLGVAVSWHWERAWPELSSIHKDLAKLLIASGADVNIGGPLHSAAENGWKQIVELLIENGANVNARDMDGRTPLYLVSKDVAEVLIANGADVNVKDNEGYTPLHWATFYGNRDKDVVELLITKGAEVNVKNKWGDTPLHKAALHGHKDVADFFIANGADINAKNDNGNTPLELALEEDHKDVAELLRKHGAVE